MGAPAPSQKTMKTLFSEIQVRSVRRRLVVVLFLLLACASRGTEPVQFLFRLPPDERNPFGRDLWADVDTPSDKTLRLPVFFFGGGQFAVRARASELGEYHLRGVIEKLGTRIAPLAISVAGSDRQVVKTLAAMPQVTGYRGKPARFLFDRGGETYTPVGANVPWASGEPVAFYRHAFSEFNRQDLGWMRIWMAHWGGLNLEWLAPEKGASPPPGILDLRVAADWDKIVAAAEEKNVYLQIVLQHHGQYSTTVNPNWKEHPWNAANPRGFLARPEDFFTSDVAIGLTALKYRYIAARWGYSPAVFAWELFNEVHWVDALKLGHDVEAVAHWHAEMAGYLRAVDPYHHLVTTSTENLRSAIYAKMDFYQPHLYASNLLAGAREFAVSPEKLNRPVFYGEFGDDHVDLTTAQKHAGIALVPPVWASLMGEGVCPAQLWLGPELIQMGRLGELGAVARFVNATRLGEREGLTGFSPATECEVRVPFTLAAGQVWQQRSAPELTVPLDGREPLDFARIPKNFAGTPENLREGFPGRATYHLDLPREMALRVRVTDVGERGSALRVSIDGKVALEKTWPARPAVPPTREKPAIVSFSVPAGQHTLLVENPGAPDWFELAGIDFPQEIPVLAAIGRRGADFIALWVWHREGVFAVKSPRAVAGSLLLEDVPAGSWSVVWWDTLKGIPSAAKILNHPGGLLKVPTPLIDRHAAVVLTRVQ